MNIDVRRHTSMCCESVFRKGSKSARTVVRPPSRHSYLSRRPRDRSRVTKWFLSAPPPKRDVMTCHLYQAAVNSHWQGRRGWGVAAGDLALVQTRKPEEYPVSYPET